MIPIASFAQIAADLRALRRLDPASRSTRRWRPLGRRRRSAEFELGVAYAAQQCAELLVAGAPGIHFYALNRAPGDAGRARRAAGLAAVGAGREADPAPAAGVRRPQ